MVWAMLLYTAREKDTFQHSQAGKRRSLNLLTSAYLELIRNSMQNPKRGRSVLAVFGVISMLNFSALNKGRGVSTETPRDYQHKAYSLGFGRSGLSFAFDQKI